MSNQSSAPAKQEMRKAAFKESPYTIVASSPMADERSRVLKHGETFAVFDHYGDIKPIGLGEEGIYREGTRFLSCLVLTLGSERPLFLSSTVKEENDLLAVDLMNPDIVEEGKKKIPRGTLHISRIKSIWKDACYERLRLGNYGQDPITVSFTIYYEADYADIFEVRGSKRPQRGTYQEPQVTEDTVLLAYEGRDGVLRETRLYFTPRPTSLTGTEAVFSLTLGPKKEADFYLTIVCEMGKATAAHLSFAEALAATNQAIAASETGACTLRTSNGHFNDWLNRTNSDIHMMITETPEGPYPYAGIPWFSTVFGRDGLVTALACLWLNPELAKGVLAYLATTQAQKVVPAQDAEPGKILHEMRQGEMAALGEIPFGRYYGSVDATPLFVLLAGAYYQRTGDRAFIERLWPHILAALQWMDTYGDKDKDGFVEYQRQSATGLAQQGWKDSHDAIFHADGTLAKGPIALCEVQGYVYAAKRGAAELALLLGEEARAIALRQEAHTLQERFEKAYWCEDLSTYALALDGDKRPCRVRTSNAGQCLFTGIASAAHAQRTAQTLLAKESFSGWGVRTVATSEIRYNPMAYHNGSVWPHDNALIAAGLARYGLKDAVLQLLTGLFDTSMHVDLYRMPELFCGFPRRPGEGPTLYPVACAPQAWSAVAVYLLLQASLGLQINAPEKRLCFSHPLLPDYLKKIWIQNLRVGDAVVDLLLLRHEKNVGIQVLRREGTVEIVSIK